MPSQRHDSDGGLLRDIDPKLLQSARHSFSTAGRGSSPTRMHLPQQRPHPLVTLSDTGLYRELLTYPAYR